MTKEVHRHDAEELCEAGLNLYARALREGRTTRAEAEAAPCLLAGGLLRPDDGDPALLQPVPPALALHRRLRVLGERVSDERRFTARLVDDFAPLLRIGPRTVPAPDEPALRIHNGLDAINEAITQAMAEASTELLSIQPHRDSRHVKPDRDAQALARDQALLDRGARIRALYQHTLRHSPLVLARYEELRGDVEARTLDEITERLVVIDRTLAFVPSNKERSLALEVRHPALVAYFVTLFERFWRLATPMYPQAVQRPSLNGVTPRQQAIAALLVEGHTDAVIADRLGMNIRTARVHIAKLAATLGSRSRPQLGYLIARSGILEQERARD
ncbi:MULTISPECIES: helix-turn-helix transcriptional regulator [Streptomyces]|uniref:Helix-turn-helix transcriptional regulator n=2 Tax=Streptomyces TaxID=1883 RepID=A0ABV9JAF7_9ACTN